MDSFDKKPSGTKMAWRAWKSAIAAVGKMPLLFASAVIVSALLSAIFAEAQKYLPINSATLASRLMARQSVGFADAIPFELLSLSSILIGAIVWAPVAVAVHRFILLGEIAPGIISFRPSHTKRFAGWLIAVQLLRSMVGLQMFLPHAVSFLGSIASTAVLVFCLWLMLLFPAIAIDVPSISWSERIETSFGNTAGNFWLLFRAVFMVSIPLWLETCGLLVLSLKGNAQGFIDFVAASSRWPWLLLLAPFNILFIAVAAAVASWFYAWVIQSKQPGATP